MVSHTIQGSGLFYQGSGENVKTELTLFNCASKVVLKRATDVDRFHLKAKSSLACLKPEVDNINIYKLKSVPADLSKLRNLEERVLLNKVCLIN